MGKNAELCLQIRLNCAKDGPLFFSATDKTNLAVGMSVAIFYPTKL
jgi:hypothetical protein